MKWIAPINLGILICFTLFYVIHGLVTNDKPKIALKTEVITDTVYVEKQTNADALIEAMIYVESRGDEKAVSNKNAKGVLQFTPIMIAEINRILGEERYMHDDAYDRDKSIEMFHIFVSRYSPDYDMHLILKYWNPFSKVNYHVAVQNKYNELTQN